MYGLDRRGRGTDDKMGLSGLNAEALEVQENISDNLRGFLKRIDKSCQVGTIILYIQS